MLHTTVFNADLLVQCRGKAKGYRPFHLCTYGVGIDRGSAIDGTHDAMNMNPVLPRDRDLRYLCDPTAKALVHGDPSTVTEMDALVAYLQMLGTLVDFNVYRADQNLR